MNDNRNMILAIVLSALVLLGWSFLSEQLLPDRQPAGRPRSRTARSSPLPQPQADPGRRRAAGDPRPRASCCAKRRGCAIETPRLEGSINLKGARIDDLVLIRQRETIAKNSPPVRLLSPAGAPGQPISPASAGPARASPRPTPTRVWTASAPVLAPGKPGHPELDQPAGQRFQLDLAVDDDYLFTVEQRVVNRGTGAGRGPALSASSAAPASRPTSTAGPSMSARSACSTAPPIMTSTGTRSPRTGRRSALRQPRRLARLHRQILADRAGSRRRRADRRQLPPRAQRRLPGRLSPMRRSIVAPGQAVTTETRLFAGAKEMRLLDRYEDAGHPELDRAIDWGWFRLVHAADLRPAELAVQAHSAISAWRSSA